MLDVIIEYSNIGYLAISEVNSGKGGGARICTKDM